MKSLHWILFVFLLGGCSVFKQSTSSSFASFNFDLQYKSSNESFNLRGLANVNADSGYLNIYGPLGINVSKIFILNDSLAVVDLVNKKIYKMMRVNLSAGFNNIFAGIFSQKEEHLVSSLCYLFLNNGSSETSYQKPEFYFDFDRGNTKQRINLFMIENGNKHLIKIKMKPANFKMISSSSLSKYNFEIITINLQ